MIRKKYTKFEKDLSNALDKAKRTDKGTDRQGDSSLLFWRGYNEHFNKSKVPFDLSSGSSKILKEEKYTKSRFF